jgi:hypothetical protein
MHMVAVARCRQRCVARFHNTDYWLLLLLLQVGSPEQRQLEVQLDSTRQLIKLQHFCQVRFSSAYLWGLVTSATAPLAPACVEYCV